MTGLPQPGVRARPDWSFVSSGGPGCRWEGAELTLLGFALGGVHPPAHSWLIDLKALTGALQEVYGPRFALGDRDLLLQRAVDAQAEGHPRLAGILADMIRFPPLSYAERAVAVGTLSRLLGHGRKSGFNPRVSYDFAGLEYAQWNPELHPRHPAASAGGIGGEFAPKLDASSPVPSAPPADKRRLPSVRDHWGTMKSTVERLDAAPEEKFWLSQTWAFEGGLAGQFKGTAKEVFGGITKKTLDDAREKAKEGDAHLRSLNLPEWPYRLSTRQVVELYRHHLDRGLRLAGGIEALKEVEDHRVFAAVADTITRHGEGGSGRLIRGAIKDVVDSLSHDQRRGLGVSDESWRNEQGLMRASPLGALQALVRAGYARRVLDAIADRRESSGLKSQGDLDRYRHFRFSP